MLVFSLNILNIKWDIHILNGLKLETTELYRMASYACKVYSNSVIQFQGTYLDFEILMLVTT